MITKQQFVDIINRLKEVNDFVNDTNDRARKLKYAIISDFYNAMSLSISHESIVVELLENMFNDKENLSYWLYECDYGKKYNELGIYEDGKKLDLSTPDKLYDYLLKESDVKE